MAFLPVKGDRRTVMTCDFVTIIDGMVLYSDVVWASIKNNAEVEEEIKQLGEDRARRAGVILDTAKDGYYTADLCIPDFEKVTLVTNKTKVKSVQLGKTLSFVKFIVESGGVGVEGGGLWIVVH